ncbi:hypothetical protein ACWCQP_45935 [Streptomyces chartreusis]
MTLEASPHGPPQGQLPVREPLVALNALPTAPAEASPVNPFGVPAGEVVDRRFDLTRLRRVRIIDESGEPTS